MHTCARKKRTNLKSTALYHISNLGRNYPVLEYKQIASLSNCVIVTKLVLLLELDKLEFAWCGDR